jgi:hypothetical protein
MKASGKLPGRDACDGGGGSVVPLDSSQPRPQLTESQPVGSQSQPTTWEVGAWSAVPIINMSIPQNDWSLLTEMEVKGTA